jgi:hypothetical protein
MNAQEVISGLILNVARSAVPADAEQLMLLPDCGSKNKRLMPLLIGLVDALMVTADAVADNAWDEGYPVDAVLAAQLQEHCSFINCAIATAASQLATKKPA